MAGINDAVEAAKKELGEESYRVGQKIRKSARNSGKYSNDIQDTVKKALGFKDKDFALGIADGLAEIGFVDAAAKVYEHFDSLKEAAQELSKGIDVAKENKNINSLKAYTDFVNEKGSEPLEKSQVYIRQFNIGGIKSDIKLGREAAKSTHNLNYTVERALTAPNRAYSMGIADGLAKMGYIGSAAKIYNHLGKLGKAGRQLAEGIDIAKKSGLNWQINDFYKIAEKAGFNGERKQSQSLTQRLGTHYASASVIALFLVSLIIFSISKPNMTGAVIGGNNTYLISGIFSAIFLLILIALLLRTRK